MDTIERYTPALAREWDDFVGRSRNGTFLLRRGYMDYHSDRFTDCSWVVRRRGGIRAVLPANIDSAGVLHSHQGLTYGGWILPTGHVDGSELLEIFGQVIEKWRTEGIHELDYKPIPDIYASAPAQEDRYALFRLGATITGCGLSTAVPLADGPRLNQMQRRHLREAANFDWSISEAENVDAFMDLLSECLMDRHGVKPVHSADELQLLRDRFSENIRIFLLTLKGETRPDAGVCMFDTGIVAHAQYIATTARGRELNLLTPLFVRLMSDIFATRRWFDFGISTEDNGRVLNAGLLRQKFSYGGSGVIYPRYSLLL